MTSKNKIIIITLILLGVIIYATTSYEKAKDEKQQLLPVSEMPGPQESYSSDSSGRNEGQPVSRHLDATRTRITSSCVSGTQEISTYHNGSSGSLHTVICTVTAYSPDYESTGKTPDHPLYKRTATGSTAEEGRTVAADFDFLPPGSLIEIAGIGLRVVEDTGGGLSNTHIDLYFESREKAIEFGRQQKEIKVLRLGKA